MSVRDRFGHLEQPCPLLLLFPSAVYFCAPTPTAGVPQTFSFRVFWNNTAASAPLRYKLRVSRSAKDHYLVSNDAGTLAVGAAAEISFTMTRPLPPEEVRRDSFVLMASASTSGDYEYSKIIPVFVTDPPPVPAAVEELPRIAKELAQRDIATSWLCDDIWWDSLDELYYAPWMGRLVSKISYREVVEFAIDPHLLSKSTPDQIDRDSAHCLSTFGCPLCSNILTLALSPGSNLYTLQCSWCRWECDIVSKSAGDITSGILDHYRAQEKAFSDLRSQFSRALDLQSPFKSSLRIDPDIASLEVSLAERTQHYAFRKPVPGSSVALSTLKRALSSYVEGTGPGPAQTAVQEAEHQHPSTPEESSAARDSDIILQQQQQQQQQPDPMQAGSIGREASSPVPSAMRLVPKLKLLLPFCAKREITSDRLLVLPDFSESVIRYRANFCASFFFPSVSFRLLDPPYCLMYLRNFEASGLSFRVRLSSDDVVCPPMDLVVPSEEAAAEEEGEEGAQHPAAGSPASLSSGEYGPDGRLWIDSKRGNCLGVFLRGIRSDEFTIRMAVSRGSYSAGSSGASAATAAPVGIETATLGGGAASGPGGSLPSSAVEGTLRVRIRSNHRES